MEIFSRNLRRRSRELGLSDAEVARRAGLGERRYGHYVAGTREPDLGTLVKICAVLGVTPNDLLFDPCEDQGETTHSPAIDGRLRSALASMTAPQAELAAEIVETIARASRSRT